MLEYTVTSLLLSTFELLFTNFADAQTHKSITHDENVSYIYVFKSYVHGGAAQANQMLTECSVWLNAPDRSTFITFRVKIYLALASCFLIS